MKTVLSIDREKFLINGKLTYSEIPGCPEENRGLLMNARFIQGVFDDKTDASRFNRFGRTFDPEKNTDDLIAALPVWYEAGLRGFTVGFQGGGPCFTMNSMTIENNPFSPDGTVIEQAYLSRMKRIIDAADELGMVVIVSYFYGPQSRFLKDDRSVIEAVKTASNWLRDNAFTNVIIEIANEHDIEPYKVHPILFNDKGIAELMEIARRESGGMLVGCSATDAYFCDIIPKASDVVLIHGNNMSRQRYYNLIRQVKKLDLHRPIVCNEDSQALSNMQVSLENGVSWGYYNNMTKQEPPTHWGIANEEDRFFVLRMKEYLGIPFEKPSLEDEFSLNGLKAEEQLDDKRWLRIGALYPEKVKTVTYYRNGEEYIKAYDAPFSINWFYNWLQFPETGIEKGEVWKVRIELADGSVIIKEEKAE